MQPWGIQCRAESRTRLLISSSSSFHSTHWPCALSPSSGLDGSPAAEATDGLPWRLKTTLQARRGRNAAPSLLDDAEIQGQGAGDLLG